MLQENFKAVTNDVNILIKDAQELFHSAAAVSGEKADAMRVQGMSLLDSALSRAQELQNAATAAGKDAAMSADVYVKAHPWRAIATAGGLGLVAGLIWRNK
jgi:ElaB/YqjD/DUF883 family membrane-anchored ribosome-binding protein